MAHAGGRPTDYRDEYCEQIIELGRLGYSKVQMACELGIVKKTLFNWAEEHPEFLHALTRAEQESQAWWEKQGQLGLTADKFQASLWAKSMSARFPDDYTEKSKQELTGANGGAMQTNLTVTFVKPTTPTE